MVCSDIKRALLEHHDEVYSGTIPKPGPLCCLDRKLVFVSFNLIYRSLFTDRQLGAVEFLVEPISEDKLRNIWQHVVHKVCLLSYKIMRDIVMTCEKNLLRLSLLDRHSTQAVAENQNHSNLLRSLWVPYWKCSNKMLLYKLMFPKNQ